MRFEKGEDLCYPSIHSTCILRSTVLQNTSEDEKEDREDPPRIRCRLFLYLFLFTFDFILLFL